MSVTRSIFRRQPLLAGITVVALLGAAGAALVQRETRATPSPVAPPTEVQVKSLAPEHVRVWSSFSGRLKAVDEALVRPEVSGRVVEVRIRDGQTVRAGDVMLVIDPRPYDAALAKARADVAAARTQAEFAATEYERARNMIGEQAIPQSLHDQRANAHRVAQAAVLAADAALRQASINLDYAYVKAPIAGRVSRAEITLGNLVQAGANAPVLTKIVSNDGIYADFEVDEQSYVQTIRNHADTQSQEQKIAVDMKVQGDADHVYNGSIYTFDNSLDVSTGTIRARAKFANKDGALLPGMFVSIRLASSGDTSAILVPDVAIGSDQAKKFVYVVGPDNKVAYREVSLGAGIDGRHIVLAGLNAGDRVVTKGLQFVRPDIVVAPKDATEADLKTASAIGASATPSHVRAE
ncbi:Probable Co/Zn/Cd efflux system membrane fusion protein [Caballeronia glathei]|uniref:Hemolysin D n=1 Tax=Caballeronia glathei TaxID=60547 RepID=A0A069PNQ9_9BURK|nr:efflux RND transporter periplasmic adaptor subunit [Caballeronia glathei]KDR42230.1 hemolysin D [Caballeronia glathei]CDY77227.1 Probable Co/Zn/Cd efflux system membrane fusion protein [Caballeronia glathei]